jgi:hypothetical protein
MFCQAVYISESTLAHTLTISVIAAATAWFLFLVFYTIVAKWWRGPIGRNTFGVSFVLWVILARLATLRIWPNIHQSDVVGIILYSLTGFYAIRRGYLVWMSQYRPSKIYQKFNRRHDDPK